MSDTLSFDDGTELVFETPPWASWNLNIHRNGPGRDVAHATDPETGRNIAIHERDCLYRYYRPSASGSYGNLRFL